MTTSNRRGTGSENSTHIYISGISGKTFSFPKKRCLRCHLHRLDHHLTNGARRNQCARDDHLKDTSWECRLHLKIHLLHLTRLLISQAMATSNSCSHYIQRTQRRRGALATIATLATLATIQIALYRTDGIATRWMPRKQHIGGGTQCTIASASAKMPLENGASIMIQRFVRRTGFYLTKSGSGSTLATRRAKRHATRKKK